jgi:subtilisin
MTLHARVRVLWLLAGVLVAGCVDDDAITPTAPNLQRALLSQVRDVPELTIDLPPSPRPWDTSAIALADVLEREDGHAVIGFKHPTARRVLDGTGQQAVRSRLASGVIAQALSLLTSKDVEILEYFATTGDVHVRLDPAIATELFAHPLINYIEPRKWGWIATTGIARAQLDIVAALSTQTIPWGISTIRAPQAWSKTQGSGASILVIDTGHDQGHQDLPAVPDANCGGAHDGCTDWASTGWHGTHVMGIATARNNSIGVVGTAPGVQSASVYAWGACNDDRICSSDAVKAGISAGHSWGVDVINMSLGMDYDAGIAAEISAANNAGVVLVASVGNHCHVTGCVSNEPEQFPASHTNVIGVSGINVDKSFAHPSTNPQCDDPLFGPQSSNYGPHVDLSAPFDANSTIGNDSYDVHCGTSMAAPHVTGTVALVRAIGPSLTPLNVWQRLFATADDLGPSGWDPEFGEGLVNAYAATGPHTSIDGPNPIPPGEPCEWSADAYGGYGSRSYEWFKDGQLVGTDSRYFATATEPFHLELRVTDSHSLMDGADLRVQIDADAECRV